ESESPVFVGRAVVALARDPKLLDRTGQLFSSWEVAREYGLTDVDGRRPDWGKLDIDYSEVPKAGMEASHHGVDVQEAGLGALPRRTRRYRGSLPKMGREARDARGGKR